MNTAIGERSNDEVFAANGCRYVWREGERASQALRMSGRRAELEAMFAGVVLPGLERRGAARRVLGAGPRGGWSRAHWVAWRAPGDRQAVWALYVPTRRLGAKSLASLGRPVNDGVMLAAWGDGPVVAWASERNDLREALREALRALPEFLADGVASADATFAVRIARAG